MQHGIATARGGVANLRQIHWFQRLVNWNGVAERLDCQIVTNVLGVQSSGVTFAAHYIPGAVVEVIRGGSIQNEYPVHAGH